MWLGLIAIGGVGAVGVGKVGASVKHVHAYGYVVREHPVELLGGTLVVTAGVGFAPHVEPGGIEFGHKVGAAGVVAVNALDDVVAHGAVYGGEGAADFSSSICPAPSQVMRGTLKPAWLIMSRNAAKYSLSLLYEPYSFST